MPRITEERRQLWLNPRGTEAHRACLPLLLAPLGWGPWLLGSQDRRPWEHRTWLQVALNKRLSGGLSGRVLGVGRGQAPGSPPPVLTAPSQPRWGEGVEARAIPVLDTSPQPRPRGGLLCCTPALCACLALVGTLGSLVCVWSLGHRCSGFWFRAGRTSCWPLWGAGPCVTGVPNPGQGQFLYPTLPGGCGQPQNGLVRLAGLPPSLQALLLAGLRHLTGLSPSGHGPGVLPSRGEQ